MEAILELLPRVGDNFVAAISLIVECPSRIIITCVGKSGIIGRKIVVIYVSILLCLFIYIRQKGLTVS